MRLFDPLLTQLSGQGAAVHAQTAGGFGDIEAGLCQGFVDAFPLQGFQIGFPGGEGNVRVAFGTQEGGFDVVGVEGLAR